MEGQNFQSLQFHTQIVKIICFLWGLINNAKFAFSQVFSKFKIMNDDFAVKCWYFSRGKEWEVLGEGVRFVDGEAFGVSGGGGGIFDLLNVYL